MPIKNEKKILNQIIHVKKNRVDNTAMSLTACKLDWGNLTFDIEQNYQQAVNLTKRHDQDQTKDSPPFGIIDIGMPTLHFQNIIKADIHYNKTRVFFKKHPTWNKLFRLINRKYNHIINYERFNLSVSLIKENHFILKNKVNPQSYIQLIDSYSVCGLVDYIYKDILLKINQFHSEKFIKNNLIKNFTHLINEKSKDLILENISNGMTCSALEKGVAGRLHKIKNASNFCTYLKSMILNHHNWYLSSKISIANNHNIKISNIIKNTITFEIKNYRELRVFSSKEWCISDSQEEFSRYVFDDRRFFLTFNLDQKPNSKLSMYGVTVDDGDIVHAFDNFNQFLPIIIAQKYIFLN